MKEYINQIDREDYHKIVYPSIANGELVGQHTLAGDLLIVANEERYPVVNRENDDPEISRSSNPLQGEFTFPRPIKIKGRI